MLLAIFSLHTNTFAADPISPYTIETLIGNTAPDFTLNDQHGNSITLSTFRGRPVLLNFWAPWAPNSLHEVKNLIALRNQPEMSDLVILGITAARTHSATDLAKQLSANYPLLDDPELVVTKRRYDVFMVPITFLIDRDGRVKKIFYGQQEWLWPAMQKQLFEHIRMR
jgi:peroxiredoxin